MTAPADSQRIDCHPQPITAVMKRIGTGGRTNPPTTRSANES